MKGWTYKRSLKEELESLGEAVNDALDEVTQSEQSAYALDADDIIDRLREIEDNAERLIGRILRSEDRAKQEAP